MRNSHRDTPPLPAAETDDQMSAGELRRRYHQGGVPDDQLSAAQLRAKAGVVSNRKSACAS